MPELPEVNTVAKVFRKTVLNNPIAKVEVYDSKILRRDTPDVFAQAIERQSFIDTYRHGKYFFAKLDSGKHVLFHLGMTGDIHFYHHEDERPKYVRFEIFFADGLILGYEDLRKFSQILIVPNLKQYLEETRLGPDALRIRKEAFLKLFAERKTPLKAILMNQQLLAGIGNLYADEICYQARLHPGSTAGVLKKKELETIFEKMKSILKLACRKNAYYRVYPKNWFWEWRKAGNRIPKIGVVKKTKIGGRTTFFVDKYQKLIR